EEAGRRSRRRHRPGARRRGPPGRDDPPARSPRGQGPRGPRRRPRRPPRDQHPPDPIRPGDLAGHQQVRRARARARDGGHERRRTRRAHGAPRTRARQPHLGILTMAAPRRRPRRGLSYVRSVLCAFAAALRPAGCASTDGLAPAAHPVEADSLAAGRSLGGMASDDAAFPTRDWWTALGDPRLDALVREALEDSPSLVAADARVRKAQAQAGLAAAARRPTLGASAQYTGVQAPATLAPAPLGGDLQASTVLMLDFKYAPDVWGGKRAQYEAAVGQARAAQVDAQAARLALSSNLASAWIALAQAFEALDVASEERSRASRLFELGRQRVDAGIDNRLQLRQAESLIASARQQELAARQRIDALRNALSALLGKGPDRGLDIARPRLLAAPPPAVPDVLPSELLGHRADVVAARWRVEAAGRGIDAARAAF